jgi:hypothetical protein
MKKQFLLGAAVVVCSFTFSCNKNKKNVDEEENITTVKVELTPANNIGRPTIFSWKDVDGPGGNAPSIDSIFLTTGELYNCRLLFLDESNVTSIDLTPEIIKEGVDHQIYFEPAFPTLVVNNLSLDANGLPLGDASKWQSTKGGLSSIKITLKHKPDQKSANDPITKGDTDVEVTFPIRTL